MTANRTAAQRLGRVLERVTNQSGKVAATPEYGSWILGRVSESQGRRRIRIQIILTVFVVAANLIGIGVAALVVIAGAYAGTAYFFADRVPSGTKVAGVDIGGMTRATAIEALNDELAPRLSEPIQVSVADSEPLTVDPQSYSLSLNTEETVDQVVGFSWNPASLWKHAAGGTNISPIVTSDAAALDQTVADIAASTLVASQDASVGFSIPEGRRIEVPVGVASFPYDLLAFPPRSMVERGYNVVHWTDMPRGGHFIGLEEPELLLADLRAFVGGL